MLMEAGSNVNIMNGKPLHRSCALGHSEVIELLTLEYGADINAKTPFSEWSPIHSAAAGGHLPTIQFLLDNGAQVDQKTHDENCGIQNGWAALHFAADEGRLAIVQYLIENGKSTIDLRTALDDTAVAIAAEHGKWEVVKYLVTAGANIHAKRRGLNVVQWAVYRCASDLVQFVVSYGAKPDLDIKVLWFPEDMSLNELIKRDLSEPLYEKVDTAIYRGSCLLRERASHMRALSEVRWEDAPVYDPYSFDPLPPPETRAFPKHIIHIISTYDL